MCRHLHIIELDMRVHYAVFLLDLVYLVGEAVHPIHYIYVYMCKPVGGARCHDLMAAQKWCRPPAPADK